MKKSVYFIVITIVVLIVLALIPVDTSKENSILVVGKVKNVSESGVKDLVIELENSKTLYYINRGFENGFEIKKSKNELLGENVVLYFAKNWTPFAPFGTTSKHITQLSLNDKVIYSEF
ncbi:hypothetical protein [Flavobacterium terrigena]|uniref:Uncharacterized protein n=1 Tax=Flavobacterium terrigena TaxID=402734 RepID=A0A1H6Y4A8_9FLAO|nr:hypothetical protein [Flavobacterium terrigena]SEJ33867.1 hypothetical protein SAMN05660918_0070 [Flavobacterium terrigena]